MCNYYFNYYHKMLDDLEHLFILYNLEHSYVIKNTQYYFEGFKTLNDLEHSVMIHTQ